MDAEKARAFLLTLPHVVETEQWGANIVFWVGDKAIGGKMFCLLDLEVSTHGVVSYAAGAERFAERVEREDLRPAPYFARIFWLAANRWSAWRNPEWEDEFRNAHQLTLAKLPARVLEAINLPARERSKLIATRRAELAAKPKKKKTKPSRQA